MLTGITLMPLGYHRNRSRFQSPKDFVVKLLYLYFLQLTVAVLTVGSGM